MSRTVRERARWISDVARGQRVSTSNACRWFHGGDENGPLHRVAGSGEEGRATGLRDRERRAGQRTGRTRPR
ncbi:hypothetical protein T484DRAFT_1958261 [Baffinella frigidus]|nr:hypothetical protein T484DRAFT_1958261 [Cryptophyta sp. CCMP2293]